MFLTGEAIGRGLRDREIVQLRTENIDTTLESIKLFLQSEAKKAETERPLVPGRHVIGDVGETAVVSGTLNIDDIRQAVDDVFVEILAQDSDLRQKLENAHGSIS